MKAQGDNPAVVLGFLMLGSVGAAFLLFTMMGGGFFVALLVLALLPLALAVVALVSAFGDKAMEEVGVVVAPTSAPALGRSAAWGIMGAMALLGFYGATMIAVQGVGHTIADIGRHGIPLAFVLAGFGGLVGLASGLAPRHALPGWGVLLAGIGTGVGIVAMMSCCIVPVVFRFPGLSGLALALYLTQHQVAVAGIAANLLGIAWVAAATTMSRQPRTAAV